MDEETLGRAFEPFFTTTGMASRSSAGLGPASVYGTIRAHRGYVEADSKLNQETTFRIYLPASDQMSSMQQKSGELAMEGKETVLLVDDEDIIIEVGQEILEALGYDVLTAKGGCEAVEIYRANMDDIDMVLLDMVMPDMEGGEAFDRMKEICPDVKVLLSSGYDVDGEASEILARGCLGFIQKPFSVNELSQELRLTLDNG